MIKIYNQLSENVTIVYALLPSNYVLEISLLSFLPMPQLSKWAKIRKKYVTISMKN